MQTEYLHDGLRTRTVRGGAFTVTSQAIKFAIGLASTMILARILAIRDYGLLGMVAAFIGLIGLFKDLGLSQATIQRKEITHEQISALFWVNVALGVGAFLAVAALSPAVAWFYHQPRLIGIMTALGTGYLLGGLTVQHQALLQRQMRFSRLAVIDVGSVIFSVAVAISLALLGARYWALVAQVVAYAAANAAGVWIGCGWRPSLHVRGAGVRSMLSFGGYLTGSNVINYVARNADNVLIGRVWGAYSLGLYSKAYGLLLLPLSQINNPIGAVVIPGLSRLREDHARYRTYYIGALTMVAFVTMPLALFTIIFAHELIPIILGARWIGAVPIFRLLGIAALVQPVCHTFGWLYISSGRTDRAFRWSAVNTVFMVLAFVIGLPHGAKGVALAFSVVMVGLSLPSLLYATHGLPVSLKDVGRAIWLPFLGSIIAGGVGLAIHMAAIDVLPRWATVALGLAGAGGAYVLSTLYVFGMKKWIWSILREFTGGSTPEAP